MPAGTMPRMTLLPSPPQLPGPRPKTADQGGPRSGWGLPGSSDPSTPMPPDFPAPPPSPPPPAPGPALTCIWERPGGQRAAGAQEPQGPEQRQPHGSGAPGRPRAAGAGPRAEEPRRPGLPRAPRRAAQPPGPAPPPPTRPGRAPPLRRGRPRPRREPVPKPRATGDYRPARSAPQRGSPAAARSGSRSPVRPGRGSGPVAAIPPLVGCSALRRSGASPPDCPPGRARLPPQTPPPRRSGTGPERRGQQECTRHFIKQEGARWESEQDAPSLRVGNVIVAVAEGGGGELLAGRAGGAPLPHVVPARPAVHGFAVRSLAHVGLGRLRCLAHHAAPPQPGAQEWAAAVQNVRQAVALLGGEEGSEPVGERGGGKEA